MRLGRVTAIVAAVLSVVAIPALSPAGEVSAATLAKVTVQPLTVDVFVGPDRATKCRIAADLYLPSTATRTTNQPAILTTHGFGGSKADQAGMARAFAERSYVVLAYSGLGFGGSQCKIQLDHPDWDGRAASQLVDFLARLDVVELDAPGDPKVGMFGGSYGGQAQFAAAAVDDRIDALIPAVTWNDFSYALGPNNTSFTDGVHAAEAGVYKRFWTDLFAVVGALRGLEHVAGDPRRLVGCPNFTNWVCAPLIDANVTGYTSRAGIAKMREASVSSYIKKIKAPTLLLQGEDDTLFNLQEAVATYRALKAQGTPVRMIWHKWGHSGMTPAPGEIDLSGQRAAETTYLGRRALDWYAYWLRDDHARPLGPEFAYFRDWIRYDGSLPAGAEPAYGKASGYPAGDTRSFYLSGNCTLTPDRSAVVAGRQGWANLPAGVPSSYSEVLPGMDPVPPSDLPGTFAAWTSSPLTSNLVTVGAPVLDVRINSTLATITQQTLGTGGRLVVFAKLYDMAPNGSLELVHKLVSPVRVPDITKPVRIELPGIVHRFEAGHRLRVVLAAGDAAYGGNLTVLPAEVRTTATSVPVLQLPVLD